MSDSSFPKALETSTMPLTMVTPDDHKRGEIRSVEVKRVPGLSVALSSVGMLVPPLALAGFFTVQPNEVAAVTHFGKLTRLVTKEGLCWDWYVGMEVKKVSVKQLTMDLPISKIVDSRGTPVTASAIVNFRIVDAKKALFSVQNYQSYVKVNSTAILKQIVGQHSYDELKTHAHEVNAALREAVQQEVQVAGIEIISVSMNELNYAPEIAGSMLKKQQAGALVEARQLIVEGAVKIAQEAIAQLEKSDQIVMRPEDKVKIVTNLLTVTASDSEPTPVLSV